MLLLAALFLMVADRVVTVPAGQWQTVPIHVSEPHTMIECATEVEGSSAKVDAVLMTSADAELFNRGHTNHSLYATGYDDSSRFHVEVNEPGDYALLIDNRLEGRSATKVKVQVEIWRPDAVRAITLSPQKKSVVIGLSLLFFVAVAGFSARQLLRPS